MGQRSASRSLLAGTFIVLLICATHEQCRSFLQFRTIFASARREQLEPTIDLNR